MKKTSKILLIIVSFVIIFCAFSDNFVYAAEVTSISIRGGDRTISVGDSIRLVAKILPANATNKTVIWESSDGTVATIDQNSGNLVAKKEGTTTIRAIASNDTRTSITVTQKEFTSQFDANFWKPTSTATGEDEIKNIGNNIVGMIQIIGSIVSVIAIIIIGIRYMVGSVEEKAQYKETLIPYIIGAAFVFGITNILAIVYDIAKSI